MKKVLILSVFPAPYRIAVFKGLSEYYDITLYFDRNSDEDRKNTWFVKSDDGLEFKILDNQRNIEEYSGLLKKIDRFDLVICYDPWTKNAIKTQTACIRHRVDYIINADGALDINAKGIKSVIKRYFVKHASFCFAGCSRAVDYFECYGANSDKIVRHNFTSLRQKDILTQPVSPKEKRVIRTEKGFQDRITFIAVGQFIERKGFDLLLRAWNGDFEAQLLIVGGGGKKDEYLQYLNERQIKNVFIIDFLPKEQLFELYRMSDVFVMPTREDIWGLVVNEAMANGLPVLSSDRCTAGLELVNEGENGFVYQFDDTARLNELIELLINSSQELSVFSKNALKTVEHNTIEKIIESHLRSISALIGS